MFSTNGFYLKLIIVLTISKTSKFIESLGFCSDNDATCTKSILSITFGSGSAKISNKTPSDFNFATAYKQKFTSVAGYGVFLLANEVFDRSSIFWHVGGKDHTSKDGKGYMFLADMGTTIGQFFNITVNDLCIGFRYEFSVYLTNIVKKSVSLPTPNILLEVRSGVNTDLLLAEISTGDIPAYDTLTWLKYGLSFIASTESIVILIISNTNCTVGCDIAMDDITLRVCSSECAGFCTICPPLITVFPQASTLNFPLSFRRTQELSMNANIQFVSLIKPSIITKWTINQCSPLCSSLVLFNQSIITSQKQLFIPAQTLQLGTYEFQLTVTLVDCPTFNLTESTYIQIISSSVTVNLIKYGTSVITSGYLQNLTFNPGEYSEDRDSNTFHADDWNFRYYCRPYYLYDASIAIFSPQLIEENNHSCFSPQSNLQSSFQYNSLLKSSMTILSGSFVPNQTYQFQVHMIHQQDISRRSIGYVHVHVVITKPQLVVIGCVISTACSSNLVHRYLNPTTQVALFSECLEPCIELQKITWNIYEGFLVNKSTDLITWTRFVQINSSNDHRIFGWNRDKFTATSDLFSDFPNISYWRFEVVYQSVYETSTSAILFVVNQAPKFGYCSIIPLNGTTSTLFTITCSDWNDTEGIKDYCLYAWTTNMSQPMMLDSTTSSLMELRLPAGIGDPPTIQITVHIRDTFNSIAKYDISNIIVIPDKNDTIPTKELLSSTNQNTVSQSLIIFAQALHNLNNEQMSIAIANGIPSGSISISSLGSTQQHQSSTSMNTSALTDYNLYLNKYASIHEYLLEIAGNLSINSPENIQLQASSLAKLTETTNQLTRKAIMLSFSKCFELSVALQLNTRKFVYEDARFIATHLAQCATNVLSAVNGLLQDRTIALNLDVIRAANTHDFEQDPFEENTLENRNLHFQKQMAKIIGSKVKEMISLLTTALTIHLNIGQNLTINTSSVFLFIEAITIEFLTNKTIHQVGNARIHLPSNLSIRKNPRETIFLRSIMQPLVPADHADSQINTNFSTSLSLSILNSYGTEQHIQTDHDQPIELIIPRDPNVPIAPMILQEVTTLNRSNRWFHLQAVEIIHNHNLSVSLHFEIHPLNTSIAYWFIYKFDRASQINNSFKSIDGWTVFCPYNLTDDNLYLYFINNHHVSHHKWIVFGLRELRMREMLQFCSNISRNHHLPISFDEPFHFSSNYRLRTYTSGCYYLDEKNNWQSDGLTVGPLTNHYQTQCFSTHLTTFASSFLVLPSPISLNYNSTETASIHNRTTYLLTVCSLIEPCVHVIE